MQEPETAVSTKVKRLRSSNAAVVLAPGDLTIFKLIYEYRMLRREHLGILTDRHAVSLARRLKQLVDAGYLIVRKQPQEKHIYSLGRAAVQVLVEEGIADVEVLEKRSRVHEMQPLGLKHEMMLVDLHTTLELASRGHPLKLVMWREGRENHHNEFAFRPDAFFTLADSRRPEPVNLAHCFLEADRAKENHAQFSAKLYSYWDYFTTKRQVDRFGIEFFRVLTVTSTDDRARRLAITARKILPSGAGKYFFFTSLQNFSVDNPVPIFEAVHFSPKDLDRRWPLVPAPVAAAGAQAV